jgi:PAS domain S-box-containing protein
MFRDLQKEIEDRIQAESDLYRSHELLETKVAERTKELSDLNESLVQEIAERKTTERKLAVAKEEAERARDELRESETRFRALVDQAQDSIFVHDISGRFLLVNQQACDVLGYSREALLSLSVADVDPDFHVRSDPESIWTRLPCTFESYHRKNNGDIFPVEIRLSKIVYGSQEVLHAAVRDITERRQVEEELRKHRDHLEDLVVQRTEDLKREVAERELAQEALRQAKERAEAANLAKSVFLASMSHELRTPLNSVIGFSQLLHRDSALNENQRESLNIILRSGQHLLGLINDILEISKIEADQSKPANAPFDLWNLLDTVAEMMHVRVRDKQLRFALERAPDLPRYASADERKLKEVLINLVGNAVKFTEEGFVVLRARADENRGRLLFEVEDSGPGISAKDVPRLFKRFVQAENSKEGIGLGLYISKKLVGIMGGQITVATEVGKGSLFAFNIPYLPADFVKPESLIASDRLIKLAPGQPPVHVLIADDKEDHRLLMSTILREAGFDVAEARNGEEAVKLFEENPPDLVLMDLRMPVMDGREAIRRIKASEKGKGIPIIAVTASAFEEDRQKVLSSGADDFIRKPFRADILFNMIRQWLHVEYLDIEEPGGGVECLSKEDTKALIAGLPEPLAGELKKALTTLDLRTFKALLQGVAVHDSRLAGGLKRLADGYETNALLEIMDIRLQA